MADFFAARAEGYDAHMLTDVPGCRTAYARVAALLPAGTETLSDLGCGTGLELEGVYRRLPDVAVTGIDLSQAMLDRLMAKYRDKRPTLICGSYFDVPFGDGMFDAALSFQTMHHFSHDEKRGLYARIRRALKPDGLYVECDYMVLEQAEEDLCFSENVRLRREQGISEGAFYHYDTPCTVENQLRLLREAGFINVYPDFREGNTTILVAGV